MDDIEMSYRGNNEESRLLPKGNTCCNGDTKRTALKFLILFVVTGLAVFIGVIAARHVTVTSSITTSGSMADSLLQELTGSKSTSSRRFQFNVGMRNDYLLQDCTDKGMKKSFPDLDYVLLGYNILKGYPMAIGHDPGFTNPIFKADYSTQRQTGDCRFSIPTGYTIIPDVSCQTSFTSQVIKDSQALKDSMEVSAKVSGGGWGLSFGASTDYKQASQSVQSGEKVLVMSTATCQYYYSKIDEVNPPPFTESFIEQLKKLNNSVNVVDDYIDFINYFGTHFLKAVTFGARYTNQHSMTTESYESLKSSSISVEAQASYSGFGFSASVSAGFSKEHQEAISKFNQKVETKTMTVGSAPPSDGNALTWASSVKESPVPFRYEMASIEKLFQHAYMKHHPEINIMRIRKNLQFIRTRYADILYLRAVSDESGCRVYNAPFQVPIGFCFESLDDIFKAINKQHDDCRKDCLHNSDCLGITYTGSTCFSYVSTGVMNISAKWSSDTPFKCEMTVYPYKLKIQSSSYGAGQIAGKLIVRKLGVKNLKEAMNCSQNGKEPCEDQCVSNSTCVVAFQKKNPQDQNKYCCGLVHELQVPKIDIEASDDPNEYISFIKYNC